MNPGEELMILAISAKGCKRLIELSKERFTELCDSCSHHSDAGYTECDHPDGTVTGCDIDSCPLVADEIIGEMSELSLSDLDDFVNDVKEDLGSE